MCLDSGHQRIDQLPIIQSGWKKFSGSSTYPTFEAYTYQKSKAVPLDKWITAEGTEITASPNYGAGFHIYEDEKDQKGNRRVYYRLAHTRGTQDRATVVVAPQMYVPSNPDDWPPKGGV